MSLQPLPGSITLRKLVLPSDEGLLTYAMGNKNPHLSGLPGETKGTRDEGLPKVTW